MGSLRTRARSACVRGSRVPRCTACMYRLQVSRYASLEAAALEAELTAALPDTLPPGGTGGAGGGTGGTAAPLEGEALVRKLWEVVRAAAASCCAAVDRCMQLSGGSELVRGRMAAATTAAALPVCRTACLLFGEAWRSGALGVAQRRRRAVPCTSLLLCSIRACAACSGGCTRWWTTGAWAPGMPSPAQPALAGVLDDVQVAWPWHLTCRCVPWRSSVCDLMCSRRWRACWTTCWRRSSRASRRAPAKRRPRRARWRPATPPALRTAW